MESEPPRRQRPRFWDGKTVHFTEAPPRTVRDRRSFELGMHEETARSLALALARLKQTSVTLPDDCEEILQALNYVLVADPASVAAHRQMEAGKGMTPDGGHKPPEPRRGRWSDPTGPRYPSPPRDGAGFIRPEDRR